MFDKPKIMIFETIVNIRIDLVMYKIHIGSEMCIWKCLQFTRFQLHNNKGKYEFIYETFSFRGIYVWNKIYSLIEIDTNIYSFKKNLKKNLYKNSLNSRNTK